MCPISIWHSFLLCTLAILQVETLQVPLRSTSPVTEGRGISEPLFVDLEELSRIVDISYCVGLTGTGIQKPFQCLSRCHEFGGFELVTVSLIRDPLSIITMLSDFVRDMEYRPALW